ncbi:MAG: alpha/beta hydrolase [Clostridiaceae bacterium]|nr:alpha/beta hydrolase [Clostridiaceae bacterium]
MQTDFSIDVPGVPFKTGTRYSFHFSGHNAILVKPQQTDPQKRWVWRTEFFDAFPAVDDALLAAGFHLAYLQVSDRFGCPSAIDDMEAFRAWLVRKTGLAERANLFGFSRGGLYALHYATRFPDHVAVLYLDAPVLDVLSWPAGLKSGRGSLRDWQLCQEAYGFTQASMEKITDMADRQIERLAELAVPVVLVAGDADDVVPWQENGACLAVAYQKRKRTDLCQVILKPGCGHHPHSLDDPEPVVAFISHHDKGQAAHR